MTNSIYDGFRALVAITEDGALRARLEKKIEALFSVKRDEREYAEAYLDIEHALAFHPGTHLTERDIRNRMKRSFVGADEVFPGFSLLFMSDERQYIALVNELIREYAKAWRLFLGARSVERAVASSLEGSPWSSIGISAEEGLEFDPVRMRSIGECGKVAFLLFDAWHRAGRTIFGIDAGIRSFERAYRSVTARHAYLPVVPKLLGAMPLDVLANEKANRIRVLESTTLMQARNIRAAGEDIQRQAGQLQATVSELGETKEKLTRTSHARSEFITVVSHQFRTPLSSIRWNAELLTDAVLEGDVKKELGEAIDMIRLKSVYLIDTLDRVFTTLDIDTGELSLNFKNAFLWEVVQDVYGNYEKEIARKGLIWKFNRRKEQVREIPMDKDKIAMVLRILVSNAVLYNKDGGSIEVDIETQERNGKTYQICSIRDEGIGISKEDKEKIFGKFFRSKDSVLKVADGTGLGMYVAKHIIEKHRGEVTVESEGRNKGTKVSFSLPVSAE